jgi:hypothetical protein
MSRAVLGPASRANASPPSAAQEEEPSKPSHSESATSATRDMADEADDANDLVPARRKTKAEFFRVLLRLDGRSPAN